MILCCLAAVSCGEFSQTAPETFYSETVPPRVQEFRWSNGKMPKSFDPAMASAPPETDIVRAVYEGLTDTDPKTLDAIPAIATSWKSADDTRIWTFVLRKDAVWSNGEPVTAKDFVRSWQRLLEMGDKAPHHSLLHNLAGVHGKKAAVPRKPDSTPTPVSTAVETPLKKSDSIADAKESPKVPVPDVKKEKHEVPFGVEAINDHELRVTLTEPDDGFPKLVAHPMFRPVYGSGDNFQEETLNADVVTNGAFRIASVGIDGVTLDREDRYFDRAKIKLARVKFIPSIDADSALAAYRDGKVDVVTNADFEPLALKLLTPFVDFKRTTHSALNFYEFNLKRSPYNDLRVREALAISIDRERLTDGEMEGSTKPAFDFLPFDDGREEKLGSDVERAKMLMQNAGFPEAAGFPTIRLLVNRNNTQEKIARSVAKMWKDSLNIDTEVIVKKSDEFEEIRISGEYDMIRRGVVLPTSDETANMLAIFSVDKTNDAVPSKATATPEIKTDSNSNTAPPILRKGIGNTNLNLGSSFEELVINTGVDEETILTERDAIASLPAIPLYFPTSYSLVKAYVIGFEMNTLDAPSLKNVSIDSNWQPKRKQGRS